MSCGQTNTHTNKTVAPYDGQRHNQTNNGLIYVGMKDPPIIHVNSSISPTISPSGLKSDGNNKVNKKEEGTGEKEGKEGEKGLVWMLCNTKSSSNFTEVTEIEDDTKLERNRYETEENKVVGLHRFYEMKDYCFRSSPIELDLMEIEEEGGGEEGETEQDFIQETHLSPHHDELVI